ncbi:hypothetical protein [Glaciibacter psychrotolerans]|uniref:Magnesium-transporting ATPase (P-type) n=1 Tax=Glaciibacter psychrotolerans TaxID=670054 RepID=A0A7Z0EB66_9MICO|nr:hypothetical protein [Leifsonia psychrotolerans]NYJ18369.1 magnesium-transporting ATPase (P-type) [Leifsonia psychrotolerans]
MAWFRTNRQNRPSLPADDVAARTTAYVYGNLLILAALVVLNPADILDGRGMFVILGTGFSTYLAHLTSELVGHRTRRGESLGRSGIIHELRNAMPIVSSTTIPAVLLAAAWIGWLTPVAAVAVAVLVTVGRMALLGVILSHLRAEKSSLRTILAGVALAVVCVVVAAVKILLTH